MPHIPQNVARRYPSIHACMNIATVVPGDASPQILCSSERISQVINPFSFAGQVGQGASTQIGPARKQSPGHVQTMHRMRGRGARPRGETRTQNETWPVYNCLATYLPWPVPVEGEGNCTDPASTDSSEYRVNDSPFCNGIYPKEDVW